MGGGVKVTDENLRVYIGYNMKRAFNVIQADLNTALKPLGLRMITFSALAIIVGNPGLRPSDLASALSIERANLVMILSELEDEGLLSRSRSATDRRAQSLSATAAGLALYHKARKAVCAHDDRMIAAMDADELKSLRKALQQIEELTRDPAQHHTG